MALVVFAAILAAVQEELRQLDVFVAFALALHLIHKSTEPYQADFHGLVAIVPFLFGGRANVIIPAISELLGGVV